jgi:hypothetical protein
MLGEIFAAIEEHPLVSLPDGTSLMHSIQPDRRVAARMVAVIASIGPWATLAGCGDPKVEVNSELSAVRRFADNGTSSASAQSWLEHRGYECVAEPGKLAAEQGAVGSAPHWTLCTRDMHHDLVCGYYIEVHVVPGQVPSARIDALSEEVCL